MDIKKLNEELQKFIETKPQRGWSGKLKRITDLINWMSDNNILTKTDQNKKENLFHKYYRFYNDGDFPRGVQEIGYDELNSYDFKFSTIESPRKRKLQAELEKQLEEFLKNLTPAQESQIRNRAIQKMKENGMNTSPSSGATSVPNSQTVNIPDSYYKEAAKEIMKGK